MRKSNNIAMRIIRSLPLCAALAAVLSCGMNSGLGPEVDITAPRVAVIGPSNNETVGSRFTLSGTATDNVKVTLLTVDLESLGLHYRVVPGEKWQKKTPSADWTEIDEGSFDTSTGEWEIQVYIFDGEAQEAAGNGTPFSVQVIAEDKMGNAGKNSKADLSLVMDETIPSISVMRPDGLQFTSSGAVAGNAKSYALRDGNVIARLLNGDITLEGRKDGAVSFKELMIELDDGTLRTGERETSNSAKWNVLPRVEDIAAEVEFEDDERTTVYYQGIVKTDTSRGTWTHTIPADWAEKHNLAALGEEDGSGKVIRIVSTCVSGSGAWERVVLGYFVWWPEADIPWITTYAGDDEPSDSPYAMYPAQNFTGKAQDDDGISSLTYTIKDSSTRETVRSGDAVEITKGNEPSSTAFAVGVPSKEGKYTITLTVKDLGGKTATVTNYFSVSDVSPPQIEFDRELSDIFVDADSDGNITFSGTVSDDGGVESFRLIHLHPAADDDEDNLIRYMTGGELAWKEAKDGDLGERSGNEFTGFFSYPGADGKPTRYKNKILTISLGKPTTDKDGRKVYEFSKTINIFDDLGIGKESEDGNAYKPLSAQDFVFWATDGVSTSVKKVSLSGDTEAPALEILSIRKEPDGSGGEFANGVPTLNKVNRGTDKITLKGTWSDNSYKKFGEKANIGFKKNSITWCDADFTVTQTRLGDVFEWTATVSGNSTPDSTSTNVNQIKASLTDMGGNTKTDTKSVFVEAADLGLDSIGSLSPEGSYTNEAKITITLNFTKNIKVTLSGDQKPQLELNNGGVAEYVPNELNPTSSQLQFLYTVSHKNGGTEKDVHDVDVLDAIGFDDKGAKFYDANVTGNNDETGFKITLPTESSKKLSSRKIKIDTKSPTIESIDAVTPQGYYNEGRQILLRITFDEDVTISGGNGIGLTFDNGVFSDSNTKKDVIESSSNVILAYTVGSDDNTSADKTLTVTGLSINGATIADTAGNDFSFAENDFSKITNTVEKSEIVIDTTKPGEPTITPNWGTAALVTTATSFTITPKETGGTVQYSTDDGSSWQTYSTTVGSVSLSNNGTYTVKARQTDLAGNTSNVTSVPSVTVEKGDFLTRITADTMSGSYSRSTSTKEIKGRLVFRKKITIAAGATVTLNVKGKGNNRVDGEGFVICTLTEDKQKTTQSGGCDYVFTYTIEEGDSLDGEFLDVTKWSFDEVGYDIGDKEVKYSLPYGEAVKDGNKRLKANREIKILTGNPEVKSTSLDGTTLKVTFDRDISKVSGNITLTQKDEFLAPAVLSVSEWQDLPTAAKTYYEKGQNGATKNSDDTLTNDTTTKYVLIYEYDNSEDALVKELMKANKHVVSVPVVSSAVSASGSTLTVDLGGTYKLPVKGATYELVIPANVVTDSFQNKNTGKSEGVKATGIEPVTIRFNRPKQVIKPGASPNFTSGSSVEQKDKAEVKMDCRTPDVTIRYSLSSSTSTVKEIDESPKKFDTKTDDVKVSDDYKTYNSKIQLGDPIGDYNSAKGMKFAIAARAEKVGGANSELSYEYVTRTVLRLTITGTTGGTGGSNDSNGSTNSNIYEGGTRLQFKDLKVWVIGGDAPYGGNTLDPFPLAWNDSPYFKLMSGKWGNEGKLCGDWYWVSWDVTTSTYTGFAIGDVPSDAGTLGPTRWYAAECAWVAQKENYVLYPGETLEMVIADGKKYQAAFLFRDKNEGSNPRS